MLCVGTSIICVIFLASPLVSFASTITPDKDASPLDGKCFTESSPNSQKPFEFIIEYDCLFPQANGFTLLCQVTVYGIRQAHPT